MSSSVLLRDRAPAKINLTLHITGRRADGYHLLDSLVVFSGRGDRLGLEPDAPLGLVMDGPTAVKAGPDVDNLVLRAARHLAVRVPGLRLGAFHLTKRLPVAAGIGGGSSDAAAALRLLARLNGLALDDPRLLEAAQATGADVPVCVAGRARTMAGMLGMVAAKSAATKRVQVGQRRWVASIRVVKARTEMRVAGTNSRVWP